MNKTCARCQKTVYPIEELKCLDKVWHKGCFKCQECGMTLNMRTYKGYGKLPYCEAHIPKVKPTTMAETPELRRIAENTKIQSNVKYHEDFEKSKGKFTQVADDPETLRIKANTKIISNVAYHGDLEKKAAMERQRTINDNGEVLDATDNYHIQLENYAAEMLPPAAPPPAVPAALLATPATTQHHHYTTQSNNHKPSSASYSNANDMQYTRQVQQQQQQQQQHQQQQQQPQSVRQSDYSNNYNNANVQHSYQQPPASAQYNQSNNMLPNVHISSYASQNVPASYDDYVKQDTDYSNHRNTNQAPLMQPYGTDPYYDARGAHPNQRIGRIADYDPLTDGPRNSPLVPKHGATVVYNSGPPQQTVQSHHHQMANYQHNNHNMGQQQHGHGMQHPSMQGYNQSVQQLSHGMHNMNLQQQSQQQKVQHHTNNGRIGGNQMSSQSGSRRIGSVADMDPVNEVYGSSTQQQHAMGQPKGSIGMPGKIFIAMYDYEATDTDEVSFREGDLITNVSSIDEGWMTGRVERTGLTGMLPANYVELAKI